MKRTAMILSAEPLVGLKLDVVVLTGDVEPFSRTPRGFEAPWMLAHTPHHDTLSAEPLVGLKPIAQVCRKGGGCLSAEPLVGLKPTLARANRTSYGPFSRTPRGFEAAPHSNAPLQHRLSAEPLVGLKHLRRHRPRSQGLFQPNPSWV